ncbi:hypothetical protein Cadr_000005160 [Camelus dromedarius]|uniref:Uncharacterized protein n=1 Tax=Camelus dromedarius TaxID=9838 RepID=A0A5N4E3Z9_CAMDR|nr:hypothetical protein Cadr_000005160 [Camelus dromedarius]
MQWLSRAEIPVQAWTPFTKSDGSPESSLSSSLMGLSLVGKANSYNDAYTWKELARGAGRGAGSWSGRPWEGSAQNVNRDRRNQRQFFPKAKFSRCMRARGEGDRPAALPTLSHHAHSSTRLGMLRHHYKPPSFGALLVLPKLGELKPRERHAHCHAPLVRPRAGASECPLDPRGGRQRACFFKGLKCIRMGQMAGEWLSDFRIPPRFL